MVHPESIPGTVCERWEYTLDGTLVYRKVPFVHAFILRAINFTITMFLEDEENSRTQRQLTWKTLHRQEPELSIKPDIIVDIIDVIEKCI